ncbi:MAG: hypothetical protein ACOX6T_00915 [Myxococcales bacterium]|jgi:hypothetical protein
MRTILAAALVSGLVAGCASTQKSSPEATTGPTVEQTRTGFLTDVRAQELQVFSPDVPGEKTIWIARDDSTEIVRDGQPIAWNQLTEGVPVRVSFEPAAGPEKASRIEVLTGQEAEQLRSSLGQQMQAPGAGTEDKSQPAQGDGSQGSQSEGKTNQ